MSSPFDHVRLYATMKRSAIEGFLADLAAPGPSVGAALSLDPEHLIKVILELAATAYGTLPVGALPPRQKAPQARLNDPGIVSFCHATAESLRIARMAGLSFFEVPPERLEDLIDRKGTFQTFALLGARMANSGMDLRQAAGAFLIFMIDQVLAALNRCLSSPATDDDQRRKLLNDFGPALLKLDEALRRPIERKAELAARRQEMEGMAEEAEAAAQLAETCLKLQQQLVVPRQELFAAARRYLKQHGLPASPGPAAPSAPAPGPGTRRGLIR